MRRSLILLSAICLLAASRTWGSVQKGDFEIEVLGGWAMENGAGQGCDYDAVVAGETGADIDGWFASVGIGYFTSKNFQIGVAGFWSSMDGSDSSAFSAVLDPAFPTALGVYDLAVDVDTTIYGGGGRFKWHFSPDKALVPYVGALVYWASADVDVSVTGTASMVVDDEVIEEDAVDADESESGDGILWGPIVGLRYQLTEQLEVLLEYQYHMWSGDIGDLIDDGHAFSAGLCVKLK